ARGDSSCSVLRPASRWLVVRRRRSFSRSVVASWGIQSWQFWGSRLFELCAHLGSRCCPSMLRRNRLTSHSSGRLRRRLIQALVGSSCWFFVWCVSPSFALACRPSPPQLFAQHRGKFSVFRAGSLWGSVAHRSSLVQANSLAQAHLVA